MKNTARWLKPFKHAALLPLVILAIQQPLSVQAVTHDITLTENSSTDLSVTFDGSTLIPLNTAPDRWTVTFPETFIFGAYTITWEENPSSPTLGNIVDAEQTNQLFVFSDFGFGSTAHPNGSTVTFFATDSGTRVDVNFTFNDVADSAHGVPDTGSTLSMLLLPVGAFLLARGRKSVCAT